MVLPQQPNTKYILAFNVIFFFHACQTEKHHGKHENPPSFHLQKIVESASVDAVK